MTMHVLWMSLVALCLAAAPKAAAAENHALLIGVSSIAALPSRLWLRGPDNDVAAVRQALLARGFKPERITVLAERAAGSAARPTRSAIDQAFAALLAQVQPGDGVVLHLAGHGVQVPQQPTSSRHGKPPPWPEPDGLDEVFLTADTQPWSSVEGRLPNALLDDEIGEWMDALVDRGATVWAVFDTCHAAGMSRAGAQPGAGPRWRSVGAGELGVPARLPLPATASTVVPRLGPRPGHATAPRMDGRTLLFAARSHEGATEEWLPKGAGLAQARMLGVFSHAVAQALSQGIGQARGMREALQRRYAQEGRLAPVPQVLGEAALPGL